MTKTRQRLASQARRREVVAGGGEYGVGGVALRASEEVAA
jgi:hypothetical protein